MGTTLTGTTIKTTYDSLIKVTDNGPLSGSLKKLTDGLGNDSSLSLSTTAASLSGTLAVTGAATLSSSIAASGIASLGIGQTTELAYIGDRTTVSTRYIKFERASALTDIVNIQGFNGGIGFADIALQAGGANVGIGTTAPDSKLDVTGGNITINTSGTTFALFKYGAVGSETSRGSITTDGIDLTISSTVDLILNPTGNVGIGTSTPSQKLHVSGGIALFCNTAIGSGADANSGLRIVAPIGTTHYNWMVAAQQNINDAFEITPSTTVAGTTFNSPALSISATTGVISIKSGIQFPATQVASADANTLDDYEEGTWTIGVSFGGASVGVTTTSNTGTYTKIGRQVTVNGYLVLTSKGSSVGAATITGLPFIIKNNNANYSAPSLWFSNITFANILFANGTINSTRIALQEATEAGANTTIADTDFANNSQIIVSFTYFV